MSDKQKWPHAEASAVAQELIVYFRDVCSKLSIAGSLRRMKPEVGDIEFVYVPRTGKEPGVDMFEETPVNYMDRKIAEMENLGVLRRRLNVKGHESFGEKNKLMAHVRSGIPVDLFATNDSAFTNYMVCRTGPAESNVAICSAAIRKGWQWKPYDSGFYRMGRIEPMLSERQVFEFVGLPYLPPELRR